MNETLISPPAMTDEQYQAEIDSLLAQMRLMREQIQRDDARIEHLKHKTRENLDFVRETLKEMKAR